MFFSSMLVVKVLVATRELYQNLLDIASIVFSNLYGPLPLRPRSGWAPSTFEPMNSALIAIQGPSSAAARLYKKLAFVLSIGPTCCKISDGNPVTFNFKDSGDRMAQVRDEVPKKTLMEVFSFVKKFSNDAGELVRQLVRNKLETSVKSDKSFVTEVDFAVEDLLREQIEISFPDHGIFGEERESLRLDSDFRWIVDPIDGTQNLVAGLPTYGIVVGCHFRGRPIAGAIHHPALNLEYVGAYKQGCYENGRRIFNHWVKSEEPLQEIISLSTRACFKRMGREQVFDRIMREWNSTRVFYDIFATSRVIAGQSSGVLEVGMRAWDIAATEILTEESGGKFVILETTDEDEKHRRYAVVAGHPEIVTLIQQQYWPLTS